MHFVQYVSPIRIQDLNCSDMWAGIGPYLTDPVFFQQLHRDGLSFHDYRNERDSNLRRMGGIRQQFPLGRRQWDRQSLRSDFGWF